MRSVILDTGVRFSVVELEQEFEKHSAQVRVETVQQVCGAISETERNALSNESHIHAGVGGSETRWIFLFLCAAARVRPGSTPLDIARDINLARSAKGILLL